EFVKTLANAAPGRTRVIVTHRLATVADADRIYVLDHGRVVEQGSHAELLAADGLYKRMWERQSGFTISPNGLEARPDAARLRAIPLFAAIDEAVLAEL